MIISIFRLAKSRFSHAQVLYSILSISKFEPNWLPSNQFAARRLLTIVLTPTWQDLFRLEFKEFQITPVFLIYPKNSKAFTTKRVDLLELLHYTGGGGCKVSEMLLNACVHALRGTFTLPTKSNPTAISFLLQVKMPSRPNQNYLF